MTTPSGLGHADFADLVGADFALHLPDGANVPLVLTECTAGGPAAFALTFKAGPRAPAEQGSYQLSGPGFGPEPVFLVPVAQRPNDAQFPLEYQAIFNAVTGPINRLEEDSR